MIDSYDWQEKTNLVVWFGTWSDYITNAILILIFFSKRHDRFSQDILQMTGHMPGPYWQITWRFVGPVLISVLLVASIIYRSFDKPAYYAWNAEEVKLRPDFDLITTL